MSDDIFVNGDLLIHNSLSAELTVPLETTSDGFIEKRMCLLQFGHL